MFLTLFVPRLFETIDVVNGFGRDILKQCEALIEQIPEEGLDSIIMYMDDYGKGLYTAFDLKPAHKYAFIQDWHNGNNDFIKTDTRNMFMSSDVKYIIANNTRKGMQDILDLRYEKIDETDLLVLYRLKK